MGAVLYEMLSGRRAFRGNSAAVTMSAILKEDPPDLAATNPSVSPALERIVRHCLEKNAERRFQSAGDVAFDLEGLSAVSTPSAAAVAAAHERRPRWPFVAGGPALLLGVGLSSFFAGRGIGQSRGARDVTFKPLTFRSLPIFRALFAPERANGRLQRGAGGQQARTPHADSRLPRAAPPRSAGCATPFGLVEGRARLADACSVHRVAALHRDARPNAAGRRRAARGPRGRARGRLVARRRRPRDHPGGGREGAVGVSDARSRLIRNCLTGEGCWSRRPDLNR